MGINKGLLIEIERETDNTRQLLTRLKEKHFSYKPHEKSMSLVQLASHIVELHNWVKIALEVDAFDFHTMYKPFEAKSVQELLDALNNGYNHNIETISNLTEEEWKKIWQLKAGDYIIAEVPKTAAYRFIIQNHLIHHRGQLTVYMRMLDIPLPGLYGPSADEKM